MTPMGSSGSTTPSGWSSHGTALNICGIGVPHGLRRAIPARFAFRGRFETAEGFCEVARVIERDPKGDEGLRLEPHEPRAVERVDLKQCGRVSCDPGVGRKAVFPRSLQSATASPRQAISMVTKRPLLRKRAQDGPPLEMIISEPPLYPAPGRFFLRAARNVRRASRRLSVFGRPLPLGRTG
jgi:hypothetical protein